MPSVSVHHERHIGRSVGSGHCVPFVRECTGLPPTSRWRRGVLARGANLAPGTAVATFNPAGRYANSMAGDSHAAIFLAEIPEGLEVLDQWLEDKPRPVSHRVIRFRGGVGKPVNDGDQFFTIEIADD